MFDSKDDRHTLRGGTAKREHRDERHDRQTLTALARTRNLARVTQDEIHDALAYTPDVGDPEPLRPGKTENDRMSKAVREGNFTTGLRWNEWAQEYRLGMVPDVKAPMSEQEKRDLHVKRVIAENGGPKVAPILPPVLREHPNPRTKVQHFIDRTVPMSGGLQPLIDATARSGKALRKAPRTSGEVVRVHELAKEIGLTTADLVEHLKATGEYVKDGRSVVATVVASKVRSDFVTTAWAEVSLAACGCKVMTRTRMGAYERKVHHSQVYGCIEAYINPDDQITDEVALAEVYGGMRPLSITDRNARVSSGDALTLLRHRMTGTN